MSIATPTSAWCAGRTPSATSAATAEGLAEQKSFGEQGLELTRGVIAAWRAYSTGITTATG